MAAGKMSDTVIDSSCFDTPIVTGCLSGHIRTVRVDILQIDSFYVTCQRHGCMDTEPICHQKWAQSSAVWLWEKIFLYEQWLLSCVLCAPKTQRGGFNVKGVHLLKQVNSLATAFNVVRKGDGGDFRDIPVWSPSGLRFGSRDMFNICAASRTD